MEINIFIVDTMKHKTDAGTTQRCLYDEETTFIPS